jgi:hypothetical protein
MFVVMRNGALFGVYTSHRKAMQAIIVNSLRNELQMKDYSFELGVEFFDYINPETDIHFLWEMQEVTPDSRA